MEGRELALERVGRETRLAVLEDGKLCEYYAGRDEHGALSGNIYVGRVQNVLPGMDCGFVDIGLKKNAYLPLGKEKQKVVPGQLILCRVDKEPGGSKGPRITLEISVPGRLCAVLPDNKYIGVSKKIEDDEKRNELYRTAVSICETHGIIVRTAAEAEPAEALCEDYRLTCERWEEIRVNAEHCPGPKLLFAGGDPVLYAVRELLNEDTDRIRTDDPQLLEALRDMIERSAPRFLEKLQLWSGDIPLFDILRVDHQLDDALGRTVRLKSGGSLVFDETEAMTVIDVNTGKFTGKRDIEETILHTNLEACAEIARQMRLRDPGGIILVDFIDMKSTEAREQLLEKMRELVRKDRNRVHVVDMTALGLMEITRKKTRRSLSKRLLRVCGECRGEGRVRNNSELALQCAREILRRRRGGDTTQYRIRASKPVIDGLMELDIGTQFETEIMDMPGWQIMPVMP